MAYEVVNIKAGTWVQLGDGFSIDFQLLGDREAYWKYSRVQPVGTPPNNISANYVINGKIYHSSREFGSVWVWSTANCNFVINHKTIYNTRNFSKYSPKSLLPFNQIQATTTVAIETIKDTYDITVVDATGFVVGHRLTMFNNDINNAFYGYIQNIAGNVLTLNAPINDNYPVGSQVDDQIINMGVLGSKGNPEYFIRRGSSPNNLKRSMVLSRFMINIETQDDPDLNGFGDLPALGNGVVFREVDQNGKERHIMTLRSNLELRALAFDFEFFLGKTPRGLSARLSFGGEEKIGAAFELKPDSDIKITIQDDLSGLLQFIVIPEGYFLYE